jgi:SAM-dependent methyltransferase
MFGESVDDPATAAVLDLLGDIQASPVLDAPCGDGRVSRELTRRGARVVAVDLSSALLERARQRERDDRLGIRFLQGDVTSPELLASYEFDAVVCNFGLSDIDDAEAYLANVDRWLAADGVFVFSILHPCFPGFGPEIAGSWPPDRGYYQEGFWRSKGALADLRGEVGSNHRTLSTYVNALARHRFVIETFAEPALPWEALELPAVPMFLTGRCVKHR